MRRLHPELKYLAAVAVGHVHHALNPNPLHLNLNPNPPPPPPSSTPCVLSSPCPHTSSAIALLLPLSRVRAVAAWLQIALQAGICLSGNYNFFNALTALLACCCLNDAHLPRFLKSFASVAIQRSSAVHQSPLQPAPASSSPALLYRLFSSLCPILLFAYMFEIVPSPPGPVRITSAQLSPPASLQQAYSVLSGWTVQFRNFSIDMFHAEAAAALTLFTTVSLLSAAAATAREVVDPFPSSASSSRIMRNIVVVSSVFSLIVSSSLLLIIITPFSWTVPLPLLPKQALQLHSITASARLSSSYGVSKSCPICIPNP